MVRVITEPSQVKEEVSQTLPLGGKEVKNIVTIFSYP